MHDRPPIRTFRRRGRMSAAKRDALAALGPRYLLPEPTGMFDAVAAFGRRAPLVLDIGFGVGDATVEHAAAHPDHDVLAVEVHAPGIATLLRRLAGDGLANVRVVRADAVELLAHLPDGSVAAVHAFFPDPWPKHKHHPRRLVRADVVARLAALLAPGGVVHVATDLADYAAQVRRVLAAEPGLGAPVEDRADRAVTKYERLGLDAGRTIVDLRARRA